MEITRKTDDIYFIGVDIGYGQIKSSRMKGMQDIFSAGCRLDTSNSFVTGNESVLEINGVRYNYGTEVEHMLPDKTQSPDMLVQTLACIGNDIIRYNRPTRLRVALGIGMPLMLFGNKELRQKYVSYYSEKYRNNVFSMGGQEMEVTFDYVKCYPQAYAVFKFFETELTESEYIMIDIGSNTVDCFKVKREKKNGHTSSRIVENSLYTCEMGVNHLLNAIDDELKNSRIRITRDSLSDVIHGTTLSHLKADHIGHVCRTHTERYVMELLGNLKMRYDMQLPVIFIGGGYKFLEEFINKDEDIYTVKVFDTFSNAKAFEALVKANYEKDIKK